MFSIFIEKCLMKKVSLFILVLLVSRMALSAQEFRYDSHSGGCLNSQGVAGLNTPELSGVFSFDPEKGLPSLDPSISNKNLECADLRGIHFADILKSGASYVKLVNWNLKGAAFLKTSIHWMILIGGSLDGVDLDGALGYTMLRSVHVDLYTKGLPEFCTLPRSAVHWITCQM
jgi:hypothetical protein